MVGDDVVLRLEHGLKNGRGDIGMLLVERAVRHQHRWLVVGFAVGVLADVQHARLALIDQLLFLTGIGHRGVDTIRRQCGQTVGQRGVHRLYIAEFQSGFLEHLDHVHLGRGTALVGDFLAFEVGELAYAGRRGRHETPTGVICGDAEQRGVDALGLAEDTCESGIVHVIQVT